MPKYATPGSLTYVPGGDNTSLLHQIQCPSNEPTDLDNFKGFGFALKTAFPEMVGYLIGSEFTGMGSNDADDWLARAGLDFGPGALGRSKRVAGHNYFLPVRGKKCGQSSIKECIGEPAHMYVRGYPIYRGNGMGGHLSMAILEDLVDVNPISILMSMFQAVTAVKCERRMLPVGNSFDLASPKPAFVNVRDTVNNQDLSDAAKQQKIGEKVQEQLETCRKTCTDPDPNKYDNCIKDCRRIWWEEDKCMYQLAGTGHATVFFPTLTKATVLWPAGKPNCIFTLPSGVVVKAVFDNRAEAADHHALYLDGSVRQFKSETEGQSKWAQPHTVRDDRYYYVGKGTSNPRGYQLTLYEIVDSRGTTKRGKVVATYVANVNGNVKYTDADDNVGVTSPKKKGGGTLTTVTSANKTGYRIPAIAFTASESKDNTANTSSLESFRGQVSGTMVDEAHPWAWSALVFLAFVGLVVALLGRR